MFILCSYYIIYPRVCLVSCNLLKNATILELFVSFSGSFLANKRRSRLQDWIVLLFINFLFTYLIPCNVFRFMLFLPQQDFVNCRYSANLKILKAKVLSVFWKSSLETFRSTHPEVFLGKGVLKICSKFTGEHPCRNAISIKLQSNCTSGKSNQLHSKVCFNS